jgi:hypothetical protein
MNVLGKTFSAPSYAALAGIHDAGSERQTVNGWTSWKNSTGKTLAELREQLLNTTVTNKTRQKCRCQQLMLVRLHQATEAG